MYKVNWVLYNYNPKMDMADFIRNNDVDELSIDELKELMIELYKVFIDENY